METNRKNTELNHDVEDFEGELFDALWELDDHIEEISDALRELCWIIRHSKEKSAAQELYSALVAYIGEYNRVDYQKWVADLRADPQGSLKACYPKRHEVFLAIQEYKLRLPEDVFNRVLLLFTDMYGETSEEWDDLHAGDTYDLIVISRHKLFNKWLEEKGLQRSSLRTASDFLKEWKAFHKELHADYWYKRLDTIFQDYIEDKD